MAQNSLSVDLWALGTRSALPYERQIARQGSHAWEQSRGRVTLNDTERAWALQAGLGLDGLYNAPSPLPAKLDPYVERVQTAFLEHKRNPSEVGRAVYDALIAADLDARGKPLRVLATVGILGFGAFLFWKNRRPRARRSR